MTFLVCLECSNSVPKMLFHLRLNSYKAMTTSRVLGISTFGKYGIKLAIYHLPCKEFRPRSRSWSSGTPKVSRVSGFPPPSPQRWDLSGPPKNYGKNSIKDGHSFIVTMLQLTVFLQDLVAIRQCSSAGRRENGSLFCSTETVAIVLLLGVQHDVLSTMHSVLTQSMMKTGI